MAFPTEETLTYVGEIMKKIVLKRNYKKINRKEVASKHESD